jgi:hypothetical protein
VKGAVVVLSALVALAACSSSGSHATSSTTSTGRAVTTTPPPAREAAQTLADRIVTQAELPADAVRSAARPPEFLRTRHSSVAFGNLVGATRLWTTRETPAEVIAFVEAHISPGFAAGSTGTGTGGGVLILDVVQSRRVLPPNVSIAQLQVASLPAAAGGAVVRVDALVGWTLPKPANELVATSDRVAITTRAQGFSPVVAAGRVVVRDAAGFRRLRQAFDGLKVAPPNEVVHCPAITEKSYTYTVAFAGSEEGSPDIVATTGACRGVSVVAAGKTAPQLDDPGGVFFAAVTRLFK